ncbi:hypothetical protein GOP47_0015541 [Adiantum capillus-veneris]|uniref:Uncharacterized protein n=1 Tax=Adiantum capillus-veneris TaxID=13818 RepID=A0A9D4UJY1_ADICA|nr:hypothetical protein GOP47_0015541 [Adiantum capillus-veneris]
MDVWKPSGSFASGLLAKKHEKEQFKAQENSETTQNHAINAAKFYGSTFSTPIKTSCGKQAPSLTPASKLGYLSASGHKKQEPNGACWKASEDAVNNRIPLGACNKNRSLFLPSPHEPLCSPAFKANPRRVLRIQAELLPSPRRVPVKQKSGEPMNAMWLSPFSTPKKHPCATPISTKALHATCQKDDGHHHDALQNREDMIGHLGKVLAWTPQRTPISASKRVGYGLTATCQKHNSIEHHDGCVKSNALSKRSLAFTYQQSPCTSISNKMDALTSVEDDEVYDGIAKHHYDTGCKENELKLDRLAHLRSVLASSPHLSTPARRVLVKQKPKQQSEKVPSQHKKKPARNVSSSKNSEAIKSRTNRENLGALDARKESGDKANQGYGVEEKMVGEAKEPDASEGLDQAQPPCNDGIDAIHIGDLKQQDAREGTDESKQDCGDGIDELSVGESKQHDTREEGTDQAKQCGDCVNERSFAKQAAGKEATDKEKHKLGNKGADKMGVGGDLKQHNDGTADLNASKRLKQKSTTKVTGCFNSKSFDNKKPSKKIPSLSETPMHSSNLKHSEERKPRRKTSSFETPKGCKTGQKARLRTCQAIDD